jgi:ribosomal protein S18 acetylase RimI-like enzyme
MFFFTGSDAMIGPDIQITVSLVDHYDIPAIVDLYRAGGWWKDEYDPAEIPRLIKGSFAFAVAIETTSNCTVGMGRVLSDGVSDAYIQDLVILPAFRGRGIGKKIVSLLVKHCKEAGLSWIGLIAEPDSEEFYLPLGFERMTGHIPMIYRGED